MRLVLSLVLGLAFTSDVSADEPSKTIQKSESFDRDPGWEGRNNRLVPKELPTVRQDFGYSRTQFASSKPGELGGLVSRASEPAFYAARLKPKSLEERFSASGTFAITKTTPGAGIFFGFFRAEQPGGGGRPIASLGLHFDCEHRGARLAVRLITNKNQSCGTFATPFIPGKFRPTPIRNDGTRYTWTLAYDPQGAGGRGQFTFMLHGDQPKREEFEKADLPPSHLEEARKRFPIMNSFTVDLPEGYKQQGATLDHFGLMNMMKPGGQATIYFGDLKIDGQPQNFTSDPSWDGSGNHITYQAKDVGGAHNFGFSDTNHAGGKPGEIGGVFWRSDNGGYYADRVGPLTFDRRLEARGKVVLAAGGPDADMCFGWFRDEGRGESPFKTGDFLGIKVGGPTRVGHYFLPAFTVNDQLRGLPNEGPVLEPGKTYDWSLIYDPQAENGNGAITATLGDKSVALRLRPGQRMKAKGAVLDHFGMLAIGPGGQIVKLYLDDMQYTAAANR
jgi:hypothetical protein